MNVNELFALLHVEIAEAKTPQEIGTIIKTKIQEYADQFEPCPACTHNHLQFAGDEKCGICGCYLTGNGENEFDVLI